NWTNDAPWPWSLPTIGLPALLLVAALLVALTVWTYVGVPGASLRRVLTVLALRLTALLLAFLALLRPSLAFPDDQRAASTLVIAVDHSESMTTQDELNYARWEYLQRMLKEAGPVLDRLRQQQGVNVVFVRFAVDVSDFDPNNPGKADGQRTDFGKML